MGIVSVMKSRAREIIIKIRETISEMFRGVKGISMFVFGRLNVCVCGQKKKNSLTRIFREIISTNTSLIVFNIKVKKNRLAELCMRIGKIVQFFNFYQSSHQYSLRFVISLSPFCLFTVGVTGPILFGLFANTCLISPPYTTSPL